MAEHAHITSRRSALAFGAGAFASIGVTAGVAASAPQPHLDAELIRLCVEFDALERQSQAAVNSARTHEEDDRAEVIAAHVRRVQRPMVGQMCTASCNTSAGLVALANSLILWDSEINIEEDDPSANTNARLLAALLRGVLGKA